MKRRQRRSCCGNGCPEADESSPLGRGTGPEEKEPVNNKEAGLPEGESEESNRELRFIDESANRARMRRVCTVGVPSKVAVNNRPDASQRISGPGCRRFESSLPDQSLPERFLFMNKAHAKNTERRRPGRARSSDGEFSARRAPLPAASSRRLPEIKGKLVPQQCRQGRGATITLNSGPWNGLPSTLPSRL